MNEILDVLVLDPHTDGVDLIIRPLQSAEDADAFRVLNEEWIARYFVVEDQDRRQLDDPVTAYIETGGEILIAELDSRPVGCVALVPDGTGADELSKTAISPELRGRGAGRALLTAVIDHAARAPADHSVSATTRPRREQRLARSDVNHGWAKQPGA